MLEKFLKNFSLDLPRKILYIFRKMLGIQNEIYIQNQLVEINNMIPILSILWNFLNILFFGVNIFRD